MFLTIAPTPAFAATVNATFVRMVELSALSPPSPDPAGITWDDAAQGRLIVSDSEVEEMSIYQGVNVYELNLAGNLTDTGDITTANPLPNVSNEPTGLSFDPVNDYLFISDDGANKVTTLAAGNDGNFGTPDDVVVATLNTNNIGSTDSEDVAFDTTSRDLFIADGLGTEVYRVSPGPDLLFDGVGDTVTHFNTGPHSANSEGLGYDPARDTLLVVDPAREEIYEVNKTTGALLNTITLTPPTGGPPKPKHVEDVVLAPAFANPGQTNYYLVTRGVDNDSNPNENDGKMYELSVSLSPMGNQPPVANAGPDKTVTLPNNSATLVGSWTDDGLPSGTVTTLWSQVPGNPPGATIATPALLTTNVTFTSAGTYFFRLTADDSAMSDTDDVMVTVNPAGGGATVLDIPVTASADDAEEAPAGTVARASTALELVYKTSSQTVGLRFVGVSIPQGATIQNAYVQFEAKKTDSSDVTLTIKGEDADDPGTFTTAAFNISSRSTTGMSATWTPDPWTVLNQSGPLQQTPNLFSVIQEIVDRQNWAGNALVLIITGDGSTGRRRADAFNGGTAPVLHIEYV